MDNTQQLANAITKAIGYTENGGKPTTPKAGKTGEMKSVFQFTPDTWKQYAKEVLGDENAQLTPDNETYVVQQKVTKWLSEGKSPKQIASMWNAGTSEPDAHTGKFSDGSPSVGVNKRYHVKFDVPSYASKVEKYTNEFMNEKPQQPPKEISEPLNNLMKIIRGSIGNKEVVAQKSQTGNSGLIKNQPSSNSGLINA